MSKETKLSTDAYKGVRDFFPSDMTVQEYIFNSWKKTSESFGYEQYGASVLEPAELYRAKSGEEIVNEQTYTFTDRGDREVTLRPEMTPTVARMVSAKKRELGLPLRWYSIPNLFRYEQPQRGRVREHWQLNVDLFGLDSIDADVEVISLAHQIMKNFGAKDGDFSIRISSRDFMQKEIENLLIDKSTYHTAAKLIDKRDKISKEEFNKEWQKISNKNFDLDSVEASERMNSILGKLSVAGIKNVTFYPYLMRGFDYYTGLIFEIYDTNPENRRALFGGGRYDDLTSLFGGDKIPAVGFGMGDVTMKDFLETHKLLPTLQSKTQIHICTIKDDLIANAVSLGTKLRDKGIAVSVNLTEKSVGDQIKWAVKHNIPFVVVIGDEEVKSGKYKLKNLATESEVEVTEDDIISNIK